MSALHSRRGIVGVLAMLAGAPRAVEAQALEVLRDKFADRPQTGPLACGGSGHMSNEALIMKPFMLQAQREARRRQNAITRCHSMSEAAKVAYRRDAERDAQPVLMRWAKIMGWRAPNDDMEDW